MTSMKAPHAALLALLFVAPQLAALQWSTHGPFGGNVAQIAISPAAPRVIYACSGAGVFRSDDAGDTWRNVSGPLGAVQLIAVDPTNADIVLAASSAAVYRTTDGGASWRDVSGTLPAFLRPSALFIDPRNASTVYLGSRCGAIGFKTAPSDSSSPFAGSGVYKSTDGGQTWRGASDGLGGRYFSLCVEELSLDPATSQHLFTSPIYSDGGYSESYDFASSWTRADAVVPGRAVVDDATLPLTRYGISSVYGSGNFLRTTNGGLTWTVVKPSGLPAQLYNDLALDPATGRLLLGTDNGVFRSGDGGSSWVDTGSLRAPTSRLLVDRDAGFVFAATALGVFRAPSSLAGWQPLALGDPSARVLWLAADPHRPARAIAVTSDYQNYTSPYVHFGRVFLTEDGGASWQQVLDGKDIGSSRVAIDAAGDVYVNASQLWRYSLATGEWTTHTKPPGLTLVADPHRPGVLWSLSPFLPGVGFSSDGGDTWTSHNVPAGGAAALAVDATQPSTLYAATTEGIAKSTDDGATWTTIFAGGASQLFAMSAASGTRMYRTAYTVSPTSYSILALYRSDDSGVTWTMLHPPNEVAGVYALAVDPHDAQSVWISVGQRALLHSTDGGASWQDANAPVAPWALAVASDGSRIHVATLDHGVWEAAVTVPHRRAVR